MPETFIDDSGKIQTIPDPSELGGTDEAFDDSKTLFKFKRLSKYTPGESWILMIYGASKSGKTYFAGTTGPRTLYVNVGEGIETLLSPAFTQKYPSSRDMIMVDIRENNPKNIAEAFDMVTDSIDHALTKFPNKFDQVVLDEATGFRKFAMNKAMEINTVQRTTTKRANRQMDFVKSDIGDYGIEMEMIEWFLGQYIPRFKGANKHFLLLAHERQVYQKPAKIGDEATLKRIMPGFTGKTFPDKVPAYFDDVWHSEAVSDAAGNVFYRLRTAGNEMELGGSRHGGIFEMIEKNPNYLAMLNRIKLSQPRKK